jgi:TrmH family RNA methyltransferase
VEKIASKQNKRIVRLAKLISKTSFRRETGLAVAPGIKLFFELIRENISPAEIFVTEKCLKDIGEKLLPFSDRVFVITEEIAGKISDQKTPEGIFCVFERKVNSFDLKDGRYLVLDCLQDIGNVGTILRTADAFSLSGIIISPDSCDIFSPKGLRTSMGSVLRVNISEMETTKALSKLNSNGFETFAAVLSDDNSDRLENIKFPEKTAVVIGNEGNGVSKDAESLCKRKLTIPMSGKAESLNASVAAGIIMYSLRK